MTEESGTTRYPGRRAWWWYAVLAIVAISTVIVVYIAIVAPNATSIISAVVMVLAFVVALSIQVRNDLTLEKGGFVVRFGFITTHVLYTEVRSIQRDQNYISAKAKPVYRLGLDLFDGGYMYISPRDIDEFEQELITRRRKAMRGE